MSLTTAPEAKADIVTLLQGWAGLDGVQITYGGPVREPEVATEMVFLGGVEGSSDWHGMGAHRREERYRVSVFCMVFRTHAEATEQEVETRCFELWSEVIRALATAHTPPLLGGGNQQTTTFTQGTVPTLEPRGFNARLEGKIEVLAYLDASP